MHRLKYLSELFLLPLGDAPSARSGLVNAGLAVVAVSRRPDRLNVTAETLHGMAGGGSEHDGARGEREDNLSQHCSVLSFPTEERVAKETTSGAFRGSFGARRHKAVIHQPPRISRWKCARSAWNGADGAFWR